MSLATAPRTVAGDWFDGTIPENVNINSDAYLETSYSFLHFRSHQKDAVRIGGASTVYLGCMFDLGPEGRVNVGRFCLLNGAWMICDGQIEIGDYALISWNVVLMDSYRVPLDPQARRSSLHQMRGPIHRRPMTQAEARPIRIGRNTWIGFDCVVLPGVTIGEGSIVGARSVVYEDVPPYTMVAGNPARVIRAIENDEAGT